MVFSMDILTAVLECKNGKKQMSELYDEKRLVSGTRYLNECIHIKYLWRGLFLEVEDFCELILVQLRRGNNKCIRQKQLRLRVKECI